MSDQNSILPDILTDETKIFILSTDSLFEKKLFCKKYQTKAGQLVSIAYKRCI